MVEAEIVMPPQVEEQEVEQVTTLRVQAVLEITQKGDIRDALNMAVWKVESIGKYDDGVEVIQALIQMPGSTTTRDGMSVVFNIEKAQGDLPF